MMGHDNSSWFGMPSSSATFSKCRQYRYVLRRKWSVGPPFILIGLNPSTADETKDDPTIRRCISFAKREGCGSLIMLNLFAFRATDPLVMKAQKSPVGDINTETICDICRDKCVVVAWGVHGSHMDQDRILMRELIDAHAIVKCFGTTKAGFPKHPLYLRSDTPLIGYRGR